MNGLRQIITNDRHAAEQAQAQRSINANDPGHRYQAENHTQHQPAKHTEDFTVVPQGDELCVLPVSIKGIQTAATVLNRDNSRRYGLHYIISNDEAGKALVAGLLNEGAENGAV